MKTFNVQHAQKICSKNNCSFQVQVSLKWKRKHSSNNFSFISWFVFLFFHALNKNVCVCVRKTIWTTLQNVAESYQFRERIKAHRWVCAILNEKFNQKCITFDAFMREHRMQSPNRRVFLFSRKFSTFTCTLLHFSLFT